MQSYHGPPPPPLGLWVSKADGQLDVVKQALLNIADEFTVHVHNCIRTAP